MGVDRCYGHDSPAGRCSAHYPLLGNHSEGVVGKRIVWFSEEPVSVTVPVSEALAIRGIRTDMHSHAVPAPSEEQDINKQSYK
ncbi:hypothetical protein CDAR_508791 [Caerostris darwini]|uniref:Uncharacterized protein n=1 Tax=Caerostris darwini TaxID=1538125 RepID=A0AAV4N0F5_9ARAC|nr:hypothetical protein CDAR_508791 [Caerostris darwini]